MPAAPYRKAAFAVVLVAIGLFCCGMFRVVSQTEHHAYASGSAPNTVKLTAGTQYILAVRGGAPSLSERGVDVTTPECTWSVGGTEAQALTVSPGGSSSKGTNAVATFISPYTGNLHIECKNFGAVFVDDAEDAGRDTAGWYLVAGVLALTIGAGLGVSALRQASLRGGGGGRSRDDDQVETLVYVPGHGIGYDEVGRGHGGDILP